MDFFGWPNLLLINEDLILLKKFGSKFFYQSIWSFEICVFQHSAVFPKQVPPVKIIALGCAVHLSLVIRIFEVILLCAVAFNVSSICLHFSYSHDESDIFLFPSFSFMLVHFRPNSVFFLRFFSPSLLNSIYSLFSVPWFFYFKTFSPFQSNFTAFHSPALVQSMERPAAELDHERNVAFLLFITVDGDASRVRTFTPCEHADDVTGALQCQVHNHSLPRDSSRDLTVICTAAMLEEMKPHDTHTTSTQQKTCPPNLHIWTTMACTHDIFKCSRVLPPSSTLSCLLRVSTPQQDEKLEDFESNERDVDATVDIHGANENTYSWIDIWVRIHRIQYVQRLF